MDEPSATLTQRELDCLFSIITSLKSRGISVVYISHRLEEIFSICDRLTVLRDGEWIRTLPVLETDRQGIIEMMVGRSITDEFPKEKFVAGDVLLLAEGLSCGKVKDVSLEVRSGEIVGLTGLVGSGRTEVARLLFGADKRKSGDLQWLGKTVDFSSPREAIKAGICFLTEDRKTQGLVLGMNVRENISLPTLQEFTRYLFVDSKKEKRVAGESIQELNIKTPSTETSVNSLSGGNQQKVVLAKWLLSQAKLFIFDEPTRGIDVGAKREIYILMNELLRRGAGILMISSELPEVLGMSDRVLVMSEGHLVCELSRDEASQEAIMQAATQQRIPV